MFSCRVVVRVAVVFALGFVLIKGVGVLAVLSVDYCLLRLLL